MPVIENLSLVEAQQLSLASLGFSATDQLPSRSPVVDVIDRLHVLQLDSVNVFARSHYLPAFSRHGSYDPQHLDQQLWQGEAFTEYWAHEAACIRVGDRPLFGWRMADFSDRYRERMAAMAPLLDLVRSQLAASGPSFARELETEKRAKSAAGWWDWSDTKRAVEMLFATGEVVSAGRTRFERKYALAGQVLPDVALATVERGKAQRQLVERAAKAYGVATLTDLADYFRLKRAETAVAVKQLVAEGILMPVRVEGWVDARGADLEAWRHRDATNVTALMPDALLTPFDPTVWFRPRAERLFNFHYRIEIYTPKEKRQYGYYCLPLMIAGQLAGRIDLKADRKQNALLVQAAWQETNAPSQTAEVANRLLAEAASWQGLTDIHHSHAGNLSLR